MQKSITSIAVRISLFIAFCSFFLSFYYLMHDEQSLTLSNLLVLSGFFIVPLCIAGFFIVRDTVQIHHKKRIATAIWKVLFAYYIIVLIYILFLSSEFARDSYRVFDDYYLASLKLQWLNHTNLTPFYTIKPMLDVFTFDLHNLATVNILGNIAVMMPMALFLPKFFPKLHHPLRFFLTIALLDAMVEIIQLLTLSGALDIDDFILNVSGCMVCYFILQIPVIKKNYVKYFYY